MEPPGVVLRVRGLGHRFGSRRALTGFDLELGRGEIVGLLGPNGSGKSTALALLAGLLPLAEGSVGLELGGAAVGPGEREYRAELGVVFQQASVDRKLSARENLELALGMHGLRGRAASERATAQLELAELEGRADEPLKNLSGGMRRRVDLVRAVAHGPRVLLLDEPTTGLDELSFRRVWDHVERLREREGLSVIVATHRAEEAARCDRLLVLDHGKTVAVDTPAKLVARVGEDVVRVRAEQPARLAAELRESLGIDPELELDANGDRGELVIGCSQGHELIVRIVESVERGRIESVSMQRPSLAEVFLHLTGASLAVDQDGEGQAKDSSDANDREAA